MSKNVPLAPNANLNIKENEELAMDLLREVVNLARAGRGYKAKLNKLKVVLNKCPELKTAIGSSFNGLEGLIHTFSK